MLPYEYRPLEHDDSIRVLTIHPSLNLSDAIICTVQHMRLSDHSLKYEALSYAWGDQTHRQAITLEDGGGRELLLGENCLSALRHLRHRDQERVLWIDAICINQEDLEERTRQVRMMDKVYRSAKGVVVYLGEHTAGSQKVFEALAKYDARRSTKTSDELTELILAQTQSCDTLVDLSREGAQEFSILLQRPWFSRLWVLQEVCMNDSVTIACGLSSASPEAICNVYLHYGKQWWGKYNTPIKNAPPFALQLMLEGPTKDPRSCSTAQSHLWHLLCESRELLATDPRD